MAALTVRLQDGRFVLDDPTDEDAPKLTLVLEDDEDELDPEDQAQLNAFLDESIAQVARGETVSAEEFLAKLKARRRR